MYDFFSMKFTQRDIRNIFDKVKRQAIKACGKTRYDRAIRYVECATMIAYQTNEIYADDLEGAKKDLRVLEITPITAGYLDYRTKPVFMRNFKF